MIRLPMRHTVLVPLLLLGVTLGAGAQDAAAPWHSTMEAAKKVAALEKKFILVYVFDST